MSKPFGVDLSKWDNPVNWPAFWAHNWADPVEFIAHRATISWGYKDPWFASNFIAMRAEVPVLAYHVLYPGESIERQVDNFLSAVNTASGSNWDGVHPVLDVELDHGKSKAVITAAILSFQDKVAAATGKRPVIYSRANWIDQYTSTGAWRAAEQWWLANYLFDRDREHPGPPALPAGVTTWLIHQTSDRYAIPAGITARPYLDSDRWNPDGVGVLDFFYPSAGLQTWADAITAWARGGSYTGPGLTV